MWCIGSHYQVSQLRILTTCPAAGFTGHVNFSLITLPLGGMLLYTCVSTERCFPCRCRDCRHSAGPLLLCSSCDADRHADVLIHRREKWDGSWESLKTDASGRFSCLLSFFLPPCVLMGLIPACGCSLLHFQAKLLQHHGLPWRLQRGSCQNAKHGLLYARYVGHFRTCMMCQPSKL